MVILLNTLQNLMLQRNITCLCWADWAGHTRSDMFQQQSVAYQKRPCFDWQTHFDRLKMWAYAVGHQLAQGQLQEACLGLCTTNNYDAHDELQCKSVQMYSLPFPILCGAWSGTWLSLGFLICLLKLQVSSFSHLLSER